MSKQAKDSLGQMPLLRAATVTFVMFSVLHQSASPGGALAAEPNVRARASELVAQLGHEEFAMREQAAAELITLELEAAAALKVGTNSHNREIRHRSAKLLALISEIDLERRFERFKNDTDPQQDYGLPGWHAYREVAGDSPAARSIFVSMHEDEPSLWGMFQDGPKRVSDALSNRCDDLREPVLSGSVQVRAGTTATLLFLATRDDVEASKLVQEMVYIACRSSSFEAAIESRSLREVFVTLVERWITRHPTEQITAALHIGLSNGLKACLPRAREIFEWPMPTLPDRYYAALCVAKFGDESDFDRLETYLEDVGVCDRTQLEGQVVVTQIRDIALAGLVRLAKQEPKGFGFDRLAYHPKMLYDISSLGFRDEPSRAHAIAAWREYRRSKNDAKPPE